MNLTQFKAPQENCETSIFPKLLHVDMIECGFTAKDLKIFLIKEGVRLSVLEDRVHIYGRTSLFLHVYLLLHSCFLIFLKEEAKGSPFALQFIEDIKQFDIACSSFCFALGDSGYERERYKILLQKGKVQFVEILTAPNQTTQ